MDIALQMSTLVSLDEGGESGDTGEAGDESNCVRRSSNSRDQGERDLRESGNFVQSLRWLSTDRRLTFSFSKLNSMGVVP